MDTTLESLQYPVGRFTWPEQVTPEQISTAINTIIGFPYEIIEAIRGLDEEKLSVPYRPGGWNSRQVVHHVADSHMNAYIRFKWALTEDNPVIKPYLQASWAELADKEVDPAVSTYILTGVHNRWATLMQHMSDQEWERTYIHPEHNKQMSLKQVVTNYEWHCRHHLRHILNLRERMGW